MADVNDLGLDPESKDPLDLARVLAANFQGIASCALATIEKSQAVTDVLEGLLVCLQNGFRPEGREIVKMLRHVKSCKQELAAAKAEWTGKQQLLQMFNDPPTVIN